METKKSIEAEGRKDETLSFTGEIKKPFVCRNGTAVPTKSTNDDSADNNEQSKGGIGQSHQNKSFKVVSGIMMSIDIVILVLIFLVVFYKNQDENFRQELISWNERRQLHVTIPCDDVSLSLDEDYETFSNERNKFEHYVDSENRNICRFSNITDVIEKMTERQARLRLARGQNPPQPISCGNVSMARKSGALTAIFTRLSPHQHFIANDSRTIIHWDKHLDRSRVAPGLTYHNGHIQVNETQFYFVYASLTFNLTINEKASDDRHRTFDDLAFRFYVMKRRAGYNGRYETRLMEYTQMLCDKPGAVGSGHVGSQLLLRPEEELFVRVSDPHRLVHDTRGNTFGLFPVS